MELGLHIADFTWNGGAATLGPQLARHARNAEAAGIARITVMDHFWQISGVGPVEHEMLEAYTTLGFLAAHTERARLHTLVTGVVYRQPGLLAKQVSTLDVLSGGRAGLGIGAAWNAEESAGLGLPFPPVAERFERLEEAIQVCLQMWSDSEAPYDGTYYHLGRTLNSPQSLQRPHPYLMIGGSGEKKTIPLAARYFDHLNVIAGFDELRHKLEVVQRRCEEIGRDPATLETSMLITVLPDENITPDQIPPEMAQRMVIGSPDSIADQIKSKVLDAGIDSLIINVPFYTPGIVNAAGEALRPLVGL